MNNHVRVPHLSCLEHGSWSCGIKEEGRSEPVIYRRRSYFRGVEIFVLFMVETRLRIFQFLTVLLFSTKALQYTCCKV